MKIKELEGKTIKSAVFMKDVSSDDTGYMRLEFTDGEAIIIQGYYDECQSGSDGFEYATRISFYNTKDSELHGDLFVDTEREI